MTNTQCIMNRIGTDSARLWFNPNSFYLERKATNTDYTAPAISAKEAISTYANHILATSAGAVIVDLGSFEHGIIDLNLNVTVPLRESAAVTLSVTLKAITSILEEYLLVTA